MSPETTVLGDFGIFKLVYDDYLYDNLNSIKMTQMQNT
jgi:hypothetical protein